MVDQLSLALLVFDSASAAAPTRDPRRKAIRTASVARGNNSLSDRADATTDAASRPVQRPIILVLAGFGDSVGFSAKNLQSLC